MLHQHRPNKLILAVLGSLQFVTAQAQQTELLGWMKSTFHLCPQPYYDNKFVRAN